MTQSIFHDIDFADFWDEDDYFAEEYTEGYPADRQVTETEQELGYKLPASYIELMRIRNGGAPLKNIHAAQEATSWSADHIAITGIFALGGKKPSSLCGDNGSAFWIEEWGYPADGVYICDCPSAGHDMILLDYSHCGPQGEPQVIHVDQENDFKKTFLAKDFETFIRGLKAQEY